MAVSAPLTAWEVTAAGTATSLWSGSATSPETWSIPTPPQSTIFGYYPQRQGSESREQAASRVDVACGANAQIIREYDNSGGTSLPPTFGGPASNVDFMNDYTSEYAGTTIFNGSCRLVPTEVAAGTHDAAIDTWFETMVARGVPFYWTFCHEFDGPIYGVHGGQFLFADWVAAQQRMYTRAQAISTTLLPAVVTYTSQSFDGAPATLNPAAQSHRGLTYWQYIEGYADGVGIDPYTQLSGQTAMQLCGSNLATIASMSGSPFACIPEIGTKNGLSTTDRLNFVTSFKALIGLIRFLCYFDDASAPYQQMSTYSPAAVEFGKLILGTA